MKCTNVRFYSLNANSVFLKCQSRRHRARADHACGNTRAAVWAASPRWARRLADWYSRRFDADEQGVVFAPWLARGAQLAVRKRTFSVRRRVLRPAVTKPHDCPGWNRFWSEGCILARNAALHHDRRCDRNDDVPGPQRDESRSSPAEARADKATAGVSEVLEAAWMRNNWCSKSTA